MKMRQFKSKTKKLDLQRIFMFPLVYFGLVVMYMGLFHTLEIKNYVAEIKNDKSYVAIPKVKEAIQRDWDNAINVGSVSTLAYSDGNVSEATIRDDLIRAINTQGQMGNWRIADIKAVTQALQFGHNNKDFRIDYRVVLSIFSIESEMNVYATGFNKWNNTYDYGVGQHNSDYIAQRFEQAVRTERGYRICSFRSATMDKFDPLTGTVATLLYLRDNRTGMELAAKNRQKFVPFKNFVVAYNSMPADIFYNGHESKYFNKFMGVYKEFY